MTNAAIMARYSRYTRNPGRTGLHTEFRCATWEDEGILLLFYVSSCRPNDKNINPHLQDPRNLTVIKCDLETCVGIVFPYHVDNINQLLEDENQRNHFVIAIIDKDNKIPMSRMLFDTMFLFIPDKKRRCYGRH